MGTVEDIVERYLARIREILKEIISLEEELRKRQSRLSKESETADPNLLKEIQDILDRLNALNEELKDIEKAIDEADAIAGATKKPIDEQPRKTRPPL